MKNLKSQKKTFIATMLALVFSLGLGMFPGLDLAGQIEVKALEDVLDLNKLPVFARTKREVLEKYQAAEKIVSKFNEQNIYDEEPVLNPPTSVKEGRISAKALEAWKERMNFYRWISGSIPLTSVVGDNNYQAACIILDRAGSISHSLNELNHENNKDVPDAFKEKAKSTIGHHNILSYGRNFFDSIQLYISEGKRGGTVGHRVILLNKNIEKFRMGYAGSTSMGGQLDRALQAGTNPVVFPAPGFYPADSSFKPSDSYWTVDLENTGYEFDKPKIKFSIDGQEQALEHLSDRYGGFNSPKSRVVFFPSISHSVTDLIGKTCEVEISGVLRESDKKPITLKYSTSFIDPTEDPNQDSGGSEEPKPTEPSEPTEPTDPEPSKPTEPSEPTEPTDPEPSKPTEPTDPSKPTEPRPSEKPTDPSKPTDPEPSKPTEPTDPSKPTEPRPSEKPTDPSKPTEPEPSKPTEPTDPSKPTEPKPSEKPTDPSEPTEPRPSEKPTDPSKPTDPKPSEKPTDPSKPTEPKPSEKPTDPSKPTDPKPGETDKNPAQKPDKDFDGVIDLTGDKDDSGSSSSKGETHGKYKYGIKAYFTSNLKSEYRIYTDDVDDYRGEISRFARVIDFNRDQYQIFDISLYKITEKDGEKNKEKVSDADFEVEILIDLAKFSDLRTDRIVGTPEVWHRHGSKIRQIRAAYDVKKQILSFKSDKFSPFLIKLTPDRKGSQNPVAGPVYTPGPARLPIVTPNQSAVPGNVVPGLSANAPGAAPVVASVPQTGESDTTPYFLSLIFTAALIYWIKRKF